MSATDWSTAEAALVAWVKACVGNSMTVLWAHQANPFAVPPPVVVLAFSSIDPVDSEDVSQAYNAAAGFDEEIENTTRMFWRCVVDIEIRTANADVTGDDSPHALATALMTAARLEANHSALGTALLGFTTQGGIALAPELFKNTWQPRATLQARFYAVTEAVEAIGYISTVRLNTTAPLPVETFPDFSVEAD